MTGHDPLCPEEDYGIPYLCLCELIENVRGDERAKHPGIPAVTRATMDVAMPLILGDLRAKVVALASLQMRRPDDVYDRYCLLRDVLALIDGSSE